MVSDVALCVAALRINSTPIAVLACYYLFILYL